jgi:hypothetical protein
MLKKCSNAQLKAGNVLILYASGYLAVLLLLVAPMTVIIYLLLSLIFKARVIENDQSMRAKERRDKELTDREKSHL